MSLFRSIFSKSTKLERTANFESYWLFSQNHGGQILEDQKNLTNKRDILASYQSNAVRSGKTLPNPELFYRNYVHLKDDPLTFDRKTLLLTCIYKFARHEWVGISAAWDAVPAVIDAKNITDKISRHHLCEEFCHVRLFNEMFRTCHLEEVKWVPLGKWMERIYKTFPYFPEKIMSAPAFVTELMGLTFYLHVDHLLDEIFADEPQTRDRIRALLAEIMVDELAHIGQRRNFLGAFGIKMAAKMLPFLYRAFFHDIPEAKHLFDISQMIKDGLAFNYSSVPDAIIQKSWVPSYCVG